MRYSPEEVEKTVGILKEGGVILCPSDTVWGLSCDATNAPAVARLGEIKGQESGPYLVLIDQDGRLHRIVKEVPEMAWEILELSSSPTSLVLPGGQNVAADVLGEDGSLGLRIVNDDFLKLVIRKLGNPIVSSSANTSGQKTPAVFSEIDPRMVSAVDYAVKYRRDDISRSKSSSIIKLGLKGEVKVLRT